jgi:ABC-type uncharacterized transport system fused permease/ATPase subunit
MSSVQPVIQGVGMREIFRHWCSSRSGRVLLTAWSAGFTLITVNAVRVRSQRRSEKRKAIKEKKAGAAKEGGLEGKDAAAQEEGQESESEGGHSPARALTLRQVYRMTYHKHPVQMILISSGLTAAIIGRSVLQALTTKRIGLLSAHLVRKQWRKLFREQLIFATMMVPAAALGSGVVFLRQRLSGLVRKVLTEEIMHDPEHFSAVDQFPQIATNEVRLLSDAAADLMEGSLMPLMSLISGSVFLLNEMGAKQLLKCYGFFLGAGTWVRFVAPSLGAAVATVQERNAEFQSHHERIYTNREEISFLNGYAAERQILAQSNARVESALVSSHVQHFLGGWLNTYVLRYMGILFSYAALVPALFHGKGEDTINGVDSANYFLTSLHLLVNIGLSARDLALCVRNYSSIKGLLLRVGGLIEDGRARALETGANSHLVEAEESKATGGYSIRMSDVTIATPDGKVLVTKLSLAVEKGQHLVIFGPNGAGKSSIFRALKGVWQPAGGLIQFPPTEATCYVPQRSYFAVGSLREHLVYPQLDSRVTDEELWQCLEQVGLTDTVAKNFEGDFTASRLALSPGELQRLAMARVLARRPRPQFVLLDECCVSCPGSFQQTITQQLMDLGITCVSITHSEEIKSMHTQCLTLSVDEPGQWEITQL